MLKLSKCPENIKAFLEWKAGVGEKNPYLSDAEWDSVGQQAAEFIVQLSMMYDSRDFRLQFGPITVFGCMVPPDVLGTKAAEYRPGFRIKNRKFLVNGGGFQELP